MLRVLLISTYDLGHQPFGLASPAAWLRAAGAAVTCLDLAVQRLAPEAVRQADMIALYLPMHTATRLAARLVPQLRTLNSDAYLCAYGLYAPVNAAFLHELGMRAVIGGEFEEPLLTVVNALGAGLDPGSVLGDGGEVVSMSRQAFRVPDRSGLPLLNNYAFLTLPDGTRRTVGYTEATRGCKHLCRHCPVVPVYGGRFRVVQRDIVLADIAGQVEQGAEHITFGDPDFFNGPAHALVVVKSLHQRFPQLTYDVTIKIEHLIKHRELLPVLRDTGCVLVTSAVESVDERILGFLDKRHTGEEFVAVVEMFRQLGLHLNPTFVAFTPWISLAGYLEFLGEIYRLGLVDHVAPVQYAIRLLIPEGSRLLELAPIGALVQPFDHEALVYPWVHPDPEVDQLQRDLFRLVQRRLAEGRSRAAIFTEIWRVAAERCGCPERAGEVVLPDRPSAVPQLSEPWYCCAEPTELQLTPSAV
ncbi:MAG TPA: CUAEP/CCAEP-tail radical SAM protein [Pseudonocardiaceae bacterium]|nr:CUAEP/CCAEP-tail radical SAM protein [Pseudonocardiaceae bacterium]